MRALAFALTTTLVLAIAVLPSPAAGAAAFDQVLAEYELIRTQLADDSLAGVPAAAQRLSAAVTALAAKPTAEAAAVPAAKLAAIKALLPELRAAAAALAQAASVAAARDAFHRLSLPMVSWRHAAGRGPAVAYCSMAKRHWLQPTGKPIGNPYMGRQMARCGELAK